MEQFKMCLNLYIDIMRIVSHCFVVGFNLLYLPLSSMSVEPVNVCYITWCYRL